MDRVVQQGGIIVIRRFYLRPVIMRASVSMSPNETEECLQKIAAFHPSRTAIQNIIDEMGQRLEQHEDVLLDEVRLHEELPISGPVEGACKNIVKQRLCRSGMRWSIPGGQTILTLRSIVKSNRWTDFWNACKKLPGLSEPA